MESFLPANFNPEAAVVTIVAGRGEYPVLLAERIKSRGICCYLIFLTEEISPKLLEQFPEKDRMQVGIGQLGKLLKALKHFHTSDVILAGQIKPQRLFEDFRPDWKAFFLLRKLKERNAETIFSLVCEQIEKIGVRVLDARSFMEEDVVKRSEKFPLVRHVVEHGIFIASEVARLNIGQSAIVKNGTVLCVEGFDGTDAMIRHAKDFAVSEMLFVKTSKPHHDFRFDVPIFGEKTLELLSASGICYVALESGNTIILRREDILKKAETLGIKIFGY